MLALALVLSCAPKRPPEGSEPIALDIAAPDPGPREVLPPAEAPAIGETASAQLPLGAGRPWEGDPQTPAQAAFVEAERILAELSAFEPPDTHAASRELARASTELAEDALDQLAAARLEADLELPALCRAGDAWRLAAAHTLALRAPHGLTPEGRDALYAELEAVAEPLIERAGAAYLDALDHPADAPLWEAHARWGLAQLTTLARPDAEQESP